MRQTNHSTKAVKPNPAAAALRFLKALEEFQTATLHIARASAKMQDATKNILNVGISLAELRAPYKL